MKEKYIPGCGNCNSFTSVCRVMFDENPEAPSLSREAMIEPPGVIEGPPAGGMPGLICTKADDPNGQKDCDHYVRRTQADDIADISY